MKEGSEAILHKVLVSTGFNDNESKIITTYRKKLLWPSILKFIK